MTKYGVFSGPFFPYLVQIRENTDQEKLRIWTLFTEWKFKYTEKVWILKFSKVYIQKPVFLRGINNLNWFLKKFFFETDRCLLCVRFVLLFLWVSISFIDWPVCVKLLCPYLRLNELKICNLSFQIRLSFPRKLMSKTDRKKNV